MKMKRLFSSVTAAALMLTSFISEMPALSGIGTVAYAEATDAYVHTHNGGTISMTVKEKTDGTFECSYSENIAISDVSYGETTVEGLKDLYTGITVEGFSFENSNIDGLTADDLSLSVSVLSGEYWDGWDASEDSNTLEFSNLYESNYQKPVRATSFHISMTNETIRSFGLSSGDTVLINLPEDTGFTECAYDGSPMTVTMGNAADGAYWGCANYFSDVEGVTKGTTTFAELKQLTDGITITDWEYEGCSIENFDPGDLNYSVIITTGDTHAYNTVSGTSVLLSDFTGIADTDVIQGIGLQISLYDNSGKYGFINGSQFTVNPVSVSIGASMYTHTYEKKEHTLFVSAVDNTESGLYAACNVDVALDGVTLGTTTFSELTADYSGISVEDFVVESSSIDGLTTDDFEIYIFMMYGNSWTWYETKTSELEFSDLNIGGDEIIRAIGYVVRLKESALTSTDLGAGDVFIINPVSDTDYYAYQLSNTDMSMTVEESGYTTSGLSASYVIDYEIPNVEYGVTTVGELKAMYHGVNIKGYSFKNSTLDGLTANDLVPTVVVMTSGTNSWHAAYSTTLMDYTTALSNASDDDAVIATGFHLSISDSSFAKLGLKVGDTITVNPSESDYDTWQPNFKFNPNNGDLSFDPYVPETDPQYMLYYNIYFNDEFIDMSESTTIGPPSLVAMQHIAKSKDYSGDIEIKIAAADVYWNENGKQETILAYADTTFTYTTDGCSVNEDLAAAGSVYYDEERRINWSVPNNAVNCIYSVYVGAEDGYIWGYYYGYQSDYGMTTDAVVNSGKDDAIITIYNVDINGCISEPVTATYSMLPEASDWTAYLTYNEETSSLTFYQLCPDTSYPVKVTDRAYELYLEGVKLGNIYSSSTSETVTHYTVLGDITSYNFNHPDDPIVEGLYNATVNALLPTGDYPVTAELNEYFTVFYNGCVVDPELGVPQNFAVDPEESSVVTWDEVEGAIGYISRYDFTMADSGTQYTIYDDVYPECEALLSIYSAIDTYSSVVWSVCSLDANGNVSEFSDKYIYRNGVLYPYIGDYNLHIDDNGTLNWDEYEGADHYVVRVTDGNETVEDECGANNSTNFSLSMALAGFEKGTYTLNVFAVDENDNELFLGDIEYELDVSFEKVGDNTFIYTDNTDGTVTITNAIIGNGTLQIPAELGGKSVSEIGTLAFAFNSGITELVIPEGVKKLGWYAFNDCENLEAVILPDSLEYIDSWAFENCDSLVTIHIPANVSTVMGGALAQNHSMTSITCDADNENYISVDGVLFTKDMSELVAYPGGKSGKYTVPASVHHIGDAAFYGAGALESVEILGALDFIGFEAFAECKKLTDVKINDGVTYVGYWAFRGCDNIEKLTVPQSVTNIGNQAFGYADYDGNKKSSFTLRGYKDSAIYFYAIRHDIPFISIGEANAENLPFNDDNSTNANIEVNPDADEDDTITSITINPAFNLKDKSEAGVGLDLTKITVKANEIYDGEGLERAQNALGTDIVGKKHYNLLDITLQHGDKDISKGYDGLIKVVIPIPKGHRDKEFYCYRILDDGTKQIIPGKRESDCYVIYLEHFSVYAMVADDEHICDFSENWSNNAEDHWHECSCGIITGIMSHTASDWITEAEATATTTGLRYKECTVCGYIMQTEVIPATSVKPTNVKATAGNGQVTLTWDAVTGATKYCVAYYNASTGLYTVLNKTLTATSYTATGLTNGTTYQFLVQAYVNGKWNAFTAADHVPATPVGTAKPTNIKAVAGDKQVTLTWDAVTGATKYCVAYYNASTGLYTVLSKTITANSYTATGLTNGTTYQFLVQAYVNGKWNTFTTADHVSATPNGTKPADIKATTGSGKVTLSWNAVEGATKYCVAYYNASTGLYTVLNKTITATSYTATGLTNGTTYQFLVQAYVNGKWNTFTVADHVPAMPHASKPSGIRATTANGKVTISWNAVEGATNYCVAYYNASTGLYNVLSKTITATSYTATGLTNGTTYQFLVQACVGGKWSTFTSADHISAMPHASKPSGIRATTASGKVTLNWNAVDGATNYCVAYYNASTGKYTVLSKALTGTSYTATGLTNGTEYQFLVQACVGGKWNAFTAADHISAMPHASKPSGIKATTGSGKVTLSWNAVEGATNYCVAYYNASTGLYTVLSKTITANSYTATGLTNGTTYQFLVQAYVNGKWNTFTTADHVSATPNGTKPADIKATTGSGKVTLSWNAVEGATQYCVAYYNASTGLYTVLSKTITATSYTATGLTNGTTYQFLVQAYVNGKWNTFTAADHVSATPKA